VPVPAAWRTPAASQNAYLRLARSSPSGAGLDTPPILEADADHTPAQQDCASRHLGVMHACNYDGRLAVALGVRFPYAGPHYCGCIFAVLTHSFQRCVSSRTYWPNAS